MRRSGAAAAAGFEELVVQQRIQEHAAAAAKKRSAAEADEGEEEEEGEGVEAAAAPKKPKGKEAAKEGFQTSIDDERNPHVYVTGLPVDEIGDTEFREFMAKCGVIAEDDKGTPKCKLYYGEDGKMKGDGRCSYFKVESVQLALMLLDGAEIVPGHPVSVTRAVFQQKGEYREASSPRPRPPPRRLYADLRPQRERPKKKGAKNKLSARQLQAKRQLGWHEQGEAAAVSKKAAGVVVLKGVFHPKQFDEDAACAPVPLAIPSRQQPLTSPSQPAAT